MRILENMVSATVNLIPKDWSRERVGDINKSDFLIRCNKMCQHLETLSKLLNQYFPTDQGTIAQASAGVEACPCPWDASSETGRQKSTIELSRFPVAANL